MEQNCYTTLESSASLGAVLPELHGAQEGCIPYGTAQQRESIVRCVVEVRENVFLWLFCVLALFVVVAVMLQRLYSN